MSLGSGPGIEGKLLAGSYAVVKRAALFSSTDLKFSSSAPSVNVKVVKLQDCDEEFDMTKREAKFAIRFTDLSSWNSSSSRNGENTDLDPKAIQHWALVVHFPPSKNKGKGKTFLFEAWKDEKTGLMQAGRADNVDYKVFAHAKEFGTIQTSPKELLEKAELVGTGEYSALFNNCQTWLKDFLRHFGLLRALQVNIPGTHLL